MRFGYNPQIILSHFLSQSCLPGTVMVYGETVLFAMGSYG